MRLVAEKILSLSTFDKGIAASQPLAKEHISLLGPHGSERPIYRCHDRPFVTYGGLLEVRRGEDARDYYEAAVNTMCKAWFVGNDCMLYWEYEQCFKRVRNAQLNKQPSERKRESLSWRYANHAG